MFSKEILHYLAANLWSDLGDSDASKALHAPISGLIASLPGLDHRIAAILALVMCSRWGNDIGEIDRTVWDKLRKLVGEETAWWCDYLGKVGSTIEGLCPGIPSKDMGDSIVFQAEDSQSLGKKGKKSGVVLLIALGSEIAKGGGGTGELADVFDKVGKGLHLGKKVEVDVVVV